MSACEWDLLDVYHRMHRAVDAERIAQRLAEHNARADRPLMVAPMCRHLTYRVIRDRCTACYERAWEAGEFQRFHVKPELQVADFGTCECPHCHEAFVARHPKQAYCSLACAY